VNERVAKVHLASHGGDVKLVISPEVSVDVSVFGAADGRISGDSGNGAPGSNNQGIRLNSYQVVIFITGSYPPVELKLN
jgi:citrate lyase alpha subunit